MIEKVRLYFLGEKKFKNFSYFYSAKILLLVKQPKLHCIDIKLIGRRKVNRLLRGHNIFISILAFKSVTS